MTTSKVFGTIIVPSSMSSRGFVHRRGNRQMARTALGSSELRQLHEDRQGARCAPYTACGYCPEPPLGGGVREPIPRSFAEAWVLPLSLSEGIP